MASDLGLLGADKTTPFTSYSFGNILAGNPTAPRLAFAYSSGTATASGSKFGVSQASGSDLYTFTEVALGQTFNAAGAAITGTGTTAGAISGSLTLQYAVTVADAFGYESEIGTPVFSATAANPGGTNNDYYISWTAVSGASTYGLYVSSNGGTTYGLIGQIATTNYHDTSGTSLGTVPPSGGAIAYRPSGSWIPYTSYVDLGDVASGTKIPVFYRENIPSGTTSAANPRSANLFTSYLV